MIKTKKDLRFYLESDLGRYYNYFRYRIKLFELWLRGSESLPIWKFIYSLRHYEYYYNQGGQLSLIGRLRKQYWRFKFRHSQLKYDFHIEPNTVEFGLKIIHPGFRKIPNFVHIGKSVTILPMVLLGKKRPGIESDISIGANCYISTGATILGPVKIGNNVIIAAGAVVNKDIPNNCIVAGVPAKIIKNK